MKKILAIAFLSLFLLWGGNAYAATLTADQIGSIVSLLRSFGADTETISQVEVVLAGKAGGSVSSRCHTFEKDLKISDSGYEVAELLRVLAKEGLLQFKTDTNNFNEEVAAAVVKLQARYGVIQTGYFGPLTRGKINSIHGCKTAAWATITSPTRTDSLTPTIYGTAKSISQVGIVLKSSSGDKAYGSGNIAVTNGKWSVTVSPAIWPGIYSVYVYDGASRLLTSAKLEISKESQASIRLESPNGGENWGIGTKQILKWNADSNVAVNVYLVRNVSGCFNLKPDMGCLAVMDPMYTLAKGISGGSDGWKVGDFSSVEYGGESISSGKYYVRVCNAAKPEVCDSSDNLFSITSGPSTYASVTVLAPNGGQTWAKGTMQMINWTDTRPIGCAYSSESAAVMGCAAESRLYDITLLSYSAPCTTGICPMSPVRMPYTIATGRPGHSYYWKVGQVADLYDAYVGDGAYTIQVCETGTSVCDWSDSYFKISGSSTTNKPPVLDGLTAPTALAIGEAGKWMVKAHDPEGGSLSYSVDWGDSVYASPSSGAAYMPYSEQTSTFTHSFSYPGTYKVTFRVKDSSGLSAETTATVSVSGYSAGRSKTNQ